jgi:hypothetical protein
VAVAVLVVVTTAACADDDDSADSATAPGTEAAAATSTSPPTTGATTTLPATVPATTSPPTAPSTAPTTTEPPGPQWTETPVEGCVCSDGSPLTIYERVADPTKVVLYFEGGGACFSAATCDPNLSPTYTVNRNAMTTSTLGRLGGYFDASNTTRAASRRTTATAW